MLIVSVKTSPPKKTNFFNIILLWKMAGRPGRSGKMPEVPFLGYSFLHCNHKEFSDVL